MRLYFIRHGQSENNRLWDLTGSDADRSEDPRLTEAGWEQADRVAGFLAEGKDAWDGEDGRGGFKITHLYSSPMFRALATGSRIAARLGLPLRVWTDWHEGGGVFLKDKASGELVPKPGMTRGEILERFPNVELDERIGSDGWWNRPFESDEERVERARRVVDALQARRAAFPDHRIAVVGHGGFYVRFVAALMRQPDTRPLWLHMNNTGISRFDFGERENTLVFHNQLAHLPPDLIT